MECPKCGKPLNYKRYGEHVEVRCSMSPFCSYLVYDPKEIPDGVHVEGEYDGKTCYNCGRPATRIDGGKWDEDSQYVCSVYPDCDWRETYDPNAGCEPMD